MSYWSQSAYVYERNSRRRHLPQLLADSKTKLCTKSVQFIKELTRQKCFVTTKSCTLTSERRNHWKIGRGSEPYNVVVCTIFFKALRFFYFVSGSKLLFRELSKRWERNHAITQGLHMSETSFVFSCEIIYYSYCKKEHFNKEFYLLIF